MNMRQLKRIHTWRKGAVFFLGSIPQGVNFMDQSPCPLANYAEVEAAKVEFVCQKVKDGSVVDTFDTREDALALVLKHAKQRKAKLQVMNSLTQELVVFAEEEMA